MSDYDGYDDVSEGEGEGEGEDGNDEVIDIESPCKDIEDLSNYTEAVRFDKQPLSTSCKTYFPFLYVLTL
jgi:hypothetical protein